MFISFLKQPNNRFNAMLTFISLILAFIVALLSGFDVAAEKIWEPNRHARRVYSEATILMDTGSSTDSLEYPFEVSDVLHINNPLPREMWYKHVDDEKLLAWLENRGSLLAEEPYYQKLKEVAQEYDVNIVLLLSIIGQEQGFVRRTHPDALRVINNPYNVYGSWQNYNSNLEDATRIACRSIKNLAKDRPESNDNFFQWINARGGRGGYANDDKWWEGVSYFYSEIMDNLY